MLSCFKEGILFVFDFLNYINLTTNSSYNNLTQYPVLRWITLTADTDELPKLMKGLMIYIMIYKFQ